MQLSHAPGAKGTSPTLTHLAYLVEQDVHFDENACPVAGSDAFPQAFTTNLLFTFPDDVAAYVMFDTTDTAPL